MCGSRCERDVEHCQGASLLRLELEDLWILVWKELSVCYIAVDPVEPKIAINR